MSIIYARQCDIEKLDDIQAVERFLDDHHRQGKCGGIKVCYGLTFEGELVQLMCFGRPRFNKNYKWELLRECTASGIQVIGGTSKLWKHFERSESVLTCICYSYPHSGSYTNHYVDYCGFRNIKKARSRKKIRYVGDYNGKHYKLDKPWLERHGVDRLLGTDIGTNKGTNEDILLGLGFKKEVYDGIDPQVDIYFPFGLVYKVVDDDTGEYYIGETTNEQVWVKGYMGSGTRWKRHMRKYPDHRYSRHIIQTGFKTPKDLYTREVELIREHVNDDLCLNLSTGIQGSYDVEHNNRPHVCEECGRANGPHKKWCSKHTVWGICDECGKPYGQHQTTCSHYVDGRCPECGHTLKSNKHAKSCSHYVLAKGSYIECPECGGYRGKHKKGCSRYEEPKICEFCGSSLSSHKKWCVKSHRTDVVSVCVECREVNGSHKNDCVVLAELKDSVCPECGGKFPHHYKTCSHYVVPKGCPECGSRTSHKKTCSKYHHIPPCPECGGERGHHRPSCSKYIDPIVCPECGGKRGHHMKFCSKYNPAANVQPRCPECGGGNTFHKKTCSKYRASVCPECGGRQYSHKAGCSKDTLGYCPDCGNHLKSHKHKPGCKYA